MRQGICNAAMISHILAKFGEVGSTHPWEPFGKSAQAPKIAHRKRAKSSITQPWIIRFRSNFAQSLNTCHPKCCKSSRSRGQRSRSQRAFLVGKSWLRPRM